jgi:hypothetical protein
MVVVPTITLQVAVKVLVHAIQADKCFFSGRGPSGVVDGVRVGLVPFEDDVRLKLSIRVIDSHDITGEDQVFPVKFRPGVGAYVKPNFADIHDPDSLRGIGLATNAGRVEDYSFGMDANGSRAVSVGGADESRSVLSCKLSKSHREGGENCAPGACDAAVRADPDPHVVMEDRRTVRQGLTKADGAAEVRPCLSRHVLELGYIVSSQTEERPPPGEISLATGLR